MKILSLFWICIIYLFGCQQATKNKEYVNEPHSTTEPIKTVVSFVYHRFGDARYPTTNTTIEQFRAHLNYLKKSGFELMTMGDAITYLKSSGPKRQVAVITVDDGYQSFYENGLPLLLEFGFPATIFINSNSVSDTDYMNWKMLRDCLDHQMEIGNHTHHHPYLINTDLESRYQVFDEEVAMCQQLILENLGITTTVFAYPYGEFDPGMKERLAVKGYLAGAAQNSGVMHSYSDFMQIPRFPMSGIYANLDQFKEKANTRPLIIKSMNPESAILSDNPPILTINFDSRDLQIDRIQCFVQGGEAELSISGPDSSTQLTIKAKKPLNRRRTLYTVTVPDTNGNWHWYSHLWINSQIK